MAIATLGAVVSCNAATRRPIVLTTDCGAETDDQWALAHLALTPEFDVRAVVTTHTGGHHVLDDPTAETSAKLAREVLNHMPLSSRPVVIPGSSVPLKARTAIRNAGVERIITESQTSNPGHRLAVLVIGAATDTASALLVDPSLSERIEIIAMGFDSWPGGGDHFNVVNDPIAWQVILDSAAPVTVGDETITKRDLSMTSQRAHALLDATGDSGRYLVGLFDDWVPKNRNIVLQVTGDEKLWAIWDEVTVAYLLGMTKSERHVRPKLRADLSFDESAKRGTITWVTAIDGARLWIDLADQLQRAQRAPHVARIWHPEFGLFAKLPSILPQR